MFRFRNCYIPLDVFTLAELRSGISHICLLLLWGVGLAYALRSRGILGWLSLAAYTIGMFFFQRRLASGLPVRFLSLRAYRASPDNFRKTSHFLKAIRKREVAAPAAESGFGARPVAVITGGERGIGQQVVEQLLREKVDVILCCPFEAEAQRTIGKLKARIPTAHVHFVKLNLNDEDNVRESAAEILRLTPRIDLLINNAGMVNILEYKANKHGNEVVLAINFLGHVLLTELLLDRIKESGPSRIVNVSSLLNLNACIPGPCQTALDALAANCDPGSPYHTHNYSLSKLLFVCYTRDLARRLKGTQTEAVTLHPGVVLTAIYQLGAIFMKAFLRTVFKFPGEGAETVLYCALADGVRSGGFYADCQLHDGVVSPLALDDAHNERLRRVLLRYFGLDGTSSHATLSLPQVAALVPQ